MKIDPQFTIDSEKYVKPVSKRKPPPGKKKNPNFLPWEEAKQFIRSELVPSRSKYMEWWDRNKPKALPRFPYRVYIQEWVSWNDFLGTNNKFSAPRIIKWRSIVEATTWAQSHGFKTQTAWMDFCRTSNMLPEDIPARPDLVYDKWRSWSHWLGYNIVEVIDAKKEMARSQVFYIIHQTDVPHNVLTFGIEQMGTAAMKQRWQQEKFDIVRVFWYDPEKAEHIKHIIEGLSTSYMGDERQRIVPNVWEIVYHMELTMDRITSKEVN
jgi:hypothetical protein